MSMFLNPFSCSISVFCLITIATRRQAYDYHISWTAQLETQLKFSATSAALVLMRDAFFVRTAGPRSKHPLS